MQNAGMKKSVKLLIVAAAGAIALLCGGFGILRDHRPGSAEDILSGTQKAGTEEMSLIRDSRETGRYTDDNLPCIGVCSPEENLVESRQSGNSLRLRNNFNYRNIPFRAEQSFITPAVQLCRKIARYPSGLLNHSSYFIALRHLLI